MDNSLLLTQIVQSLEQNENSARIKKLIFYVVKRVWSKDQNQLDSISLADLIQDLWNNHPNLDSLKKNTYKLAQTLNKPEQYLTVASTILTELAILYDLQKVATSDSDLITTPLVTTRKEAVVAASNSQTLVPSKKNIDSFELRFKIMIQVNPLKAKILLFSALEHQFDWEQMDFTSLRSTELPELLRNITSACPSFELLVNTLKSAAYKLKDSHEYLAIAKTISQALKPIYA